MNEIEAACRIAEWRLNEKHPSTTPHTIDAHHMYPHTINDDRHAWAVRLSCRGGYEYQWERLVPVGRATGPWLALVIAYDQTIQFDDWLSSLPSPEEELAREISEACRGYPFGALEKIIIERLKGKLK